MNRKHYVLLAALLCLLFYATASQAQKRLWGLTFDNIESMPFVFSMNRDGTDYREFSTLNPPALGSKADGLLKLSSGEVLLVMHEGGAAGFGTICKLTAKGIVKLYDITDYAAAEHIAFTMTEGRDGYVYALRYSVSAPNEFGGIVRFKTDGSSFERFPSINKELTRTSGLTAAAQGIYGVSKGSSKNNGFIYRLKPGLNGVDIIHTFNDGIRPRGRLLEGRDGYLYGTTNIGGLYGYGIVFKIKQDGTQYTKLLDFDRTNGKNPVAGLVQDAQGMLYGTTNAGGKRGVGVLFKINEDGTGFRKLLDYEDLGSQYPTEELCVDDEGFIYGTFFRVKNDGTALTRFKKDGYDLQLISKSFDPDVYVISPANQSSGLPLNPDLQSKPFPGTTQYTFEVSELSDFSSGVMKFVSATPAFKVKGLKAGTSYYTRVQSNVWPYYGKVTTFTTQGMAVAAEELLWGFTLDSIFSLSKDGKDYHAFSSLGSDEAGSSFIGFLKLGDGGILVTSEGGEFGFGAINKITPTGIVKLYDLEEYTEIDDIAWGMTLGRDGYIYALRWSFLKPELWGAMRFKTDGSAFERYSFVRTDLIRTSPLTAASNGVFGVSKGNTNNRGFIYKLKPDVSNIDIIYSFDAGVMPEAKLIEGRDGYLYGSTRTGGSTGDGMLFKISQDGSNFVKLFDFDKVNGRNPVSALVQDNSGVLYGTTPRGGKSGVGVMFKINEDGTGIRKLLDFANVNSAYPVGELVVDNAGYIYGIAPQVGVYKIRTDGSGFMQLKDFDDNYPPSSLQLIKKVFEPDVYVIYPEDQAVGVPVDTDIQIKSMENVKQYTLELSESADFSNGFFTWKSAVPNVQVAGLSYNTTYYTRVAVDIMPFHGPVTSFTTGSEQRSMVRSSEVVYPNPSSGSFTFNPGAVMASAVTITDMSGSVVYKNENVSTDKPLEFGSDLKKGVYILRIQDEEGVKAVRLLKN